MQRKSLIFGLTLCTWLYSSSTIAIRAENDDAKMKKLPTSIVITGGRPLLIMIVDTPRGGSIQKVDSDGKKTDLTRDISENPLGIEVSDANVVRLAVVENGRVLVGFSVSGKLRLARAKDTVSIFLPTKS